MTVPSKQTSTAGLVVKLAHERSRMELFYNSVIKRVNMLLQGQYYVLLD